MGKAADEVIVQLKWVYQTQFAGLHAADQKGFYAEENIHQNVKTPYGVAVDLGTTNVSISLCDLTGAERLDGRYGVNPQMTFGTDVMTWLVELRQRIAELETS